MLHNERTINNPIQFDLMAQFAHDVRASIWRMRSALLELSVRHQDVMIDNVLADFDRLERLLRHTLDAWRVSRGVRLDPEVWSIRDILSDIMPELQSCGRQIMLEGEMETLLFCDRVAIGRVLQNLVENAARYSDPGPVRIVFMDMGLYVWVTVHDPGPGIPMPVREKAFEPGWSGHGGSGLGLWICRQIMDLHGGRIWADGDGVHFVLPTLASIEDEVGEIQ